MEASLLEYTLTTFEACEFLSLSERTISRYVKAGLLRPRLIKNPRGIPSYRFSKAELEDIRARQVRRQGTGHTPLMAALEVAIVKEISETPQTPPVVVGQDTRQPGQDNEVICLLKENNETLKGELTAKNKQIDSLLEREKESNILLLNFQKTIQQLQSPEPEQPVQWGSGNV